MQTVRYRRIDPWDVKLGRASKGPAAPELPTRAQPRAWGKAAAGLLFILFAGCGVASYEEARSRMVDEQLRSRGIKDKRVLMAMRKVPREEFVPAHLRDGAYEDMPLPIGYGQTISQPYMVAAMTELLSLRKGDKVLEIGTGSGYHAAVLAELTPHVFSIEIVAGLARRARRTLDRLGYKNVRTLVGDGYRGWKEHAPFDAIIVTCAPDHVPKPLIQQLQEGGRMVIPVGTPEGVQTLYLLEKTRGALKSKAAMQVRFVPMVRDRDEGEQ